ncbi:MAG: DUF5989 family protein [Candidatus Sumerlaeia bacterium]
MADQPTMNPTNPTEPDENENPSLVTEFVWFLKENKKWWLIPLIVLVVVLGLLAFLTIHLGPLMPFIYPVL